MNIIRRPGGAWEKASGRRLWYNRNGNRRLTTYGEQRLINFQDLTTQIPVVESGLPTPEHPITRTRETWYPVSENSMPGLLAELQRTVPPALRDRLEDLTTLPQEFRNWVFMNLDSEGSGILDASSDRMWEEDSSGRPWFMSVQHVEVRNGQAQLTTDLADRPMLATQLLYHDVPLHWNLSPVALATQDCVPLSLCEALGTNFAQTKRRPVSYTHLTLPTKRIV